MRRPPREAPPELRFAERTLLADVEVELITRLFGGGAETRKLDRVSWLRAPALKGALRFWWRAAFAHQFERLEDLKEREDALFGAAARIDPDRKIRGGPGLVEVEVESGALTGQDRYTPIDGDPVNIAYFSAAEQKAKGIPAAILGRSGSARVLLTVNGAVDHEVLRAFRLWLVLGGAGSRTRRGAGAVAVSRNDGETIGLPDSVLELQGFLRSIARPPQRLGPPGILNLADTRQIWIGGKQETAAGAQDVLLRALREVRQDREHPPGWKKRHNWGRSRWPEADNVRFKVGHAPQHPPNLLHAGRFPRAILGLPIVMHFEKNDRLAGDPRDHVISGAVPAPGGGWSRVSRFASPVLMRPVRIWDGDHAAYVPVAVLMRPTLPGDLRPVLESSSHISSPLSAADIETSYVVADAVDSVYGRLESELRQAGLAAIL